MRLSIFRFNPEHDEKPYMQNYEIELQSSDRMLLDVMVRLKAQDDTLGLGRELLQKMIAYSRASGVEELIGQIPPENEAMIALARSCGMEVETQPGSVAVAHIDLRPERPEAARLF